MKRLRIGVQGKMYNWLSNYNETPNNLVKLREGVPQRVISPTLFFSYINDITATEQNHVVNTLRR